VPARAGSYLPAWLAGIWIRAAPGVGLPQGKLTRGGGRGQAVAYEISDSIRGSIWGLAAGDALGATLEFASRTEVVRKYGQHTDITGGGWMNLPPGAWTDDTELMLAMALGIAEDPGSPIPGVAKRLVQWYRSNPPDIGHLTRSALSLYLATGCWKKAGSLTEERFRPRAAGNGGLMRISPVGLAYHRQAALRDRWAAELTAMTHADQLCQFLSVVYCAMVGCCVGGMPDRKAAYRAALAHGWRQHPGVEPQVRARLEAVDGLTYDELRGTGYVLDCFVASVWCFLHQPSLEDAILAAVNLGDDADTTGAVTGGLAGAYYGYGALPARWVERLTSGERLDEAAQGILRVAMGYTGA